jgi:hypothetical protein
MDGLIGNRFTGAVANAVWSVVVLLCRVSDAGQESRATFTSGRRPKAAKERTRGGMVRGEMPRTPLWGFG